MYKRVLWSAIICLLSNGLCAQSISSPVVPSVTQPDSIPKLFGRWYLSHYHPSATVADTSGALVSLFAKKRTSALWYILGLPIGASALQPNETSSGATIERSAPEGWRIAIGVPLVIVSAGGYIARLATYSRSSLQQIQEQHESGKPIPAKLRRKLKPVHYANAAILRVSIIQQLQLEKLRTQQKALKK